MLYMVVEHFRNGDALPVYRRFRDEGRLAPEGLGYVASWVTETSAAASKSWNATTSRFWRSGRPAGRIWSSSTSSRWLRRPKRWPQSLLGSEAGLPRSDRGLSPPQTRPYPSTA
jgi:hypothetical protein